MEDRLLPRLSAALVLFLTVAALLVLSSLTVNAQKGGFAIPPLSDAQKKIVGAKARQVFRDYIVRGENREATDADLERWLEKAKGYLEYDNLKLLIEKMGNGFGAQLPGYYGVVYVLPPKIGGKSGIGEAYIFGVPGSDFEVLNAYLKAQQHAPVSTYIRVSDYVTHLRRRMDDDASGKVSEDEFADYIVSYFSYQPDVMK